MSKAYMAIQRQCSCLLLIFHNTVLIRRTELRLHRAGALFGPWQPLDAIWKLALAPNGYSARQFCAHDKRATPRGLQICPTPARGQWPKLVENEAPDAKVWRWIPQHRVDATSASSKRLNRADGNLQLSILIAINCPLAKSTV
jgi:hypothetical protein